MDSLGLKILACSSLLSLALVANGQSVYVKDSLRVGVRTAPDNSLTPIGVVITGMQLEVLETRGDHVRIRTDKGLEGWIKSTYVSDEAPAVIRLEKLEKAYTKLESRLSEQARELKKAKTESQTLAGKVSKLQEVNADLQSRLASLKSSKEDRSTNYILHVAIYTALFIIGLVAGIVWHRQYAMKRLGGLRV